MKLDAVSSCGLKSAKKGIITPLNFLALLTKPRCCWPLLVLGHYSLKFSRLLARPQALFHELPSVKPSQRNPRGSSLSLGHYCRLAPAEFHEISVSPLLQGRPLWYSPCSCSPPLSEPRQPFLYQAVADPHPVPSRGYQNVEGDGVSQPLSDSTKSLAEGKVNDIHCCPLTHKWNHHCS